MLQNNHAQSKYDKAETCSGMRVQSIKGTVLLGETINYDINVPFTLVHYFRNNSL
jgi:penicillin V acylase-like amidase (Ntn superfamily)